MQRNFILLCGLSMAIATLSACSNPAKEMYQKPVDQGQKAIEKARNLQQGIDQTKSTVEQQEKSLEEGQKSP
jgi:outer membrane protein assembly factor BamE (lipoprotein component of BamABCDE complex)